MNRKTIHIDSGPHDKVQIHVDQANSGLILRYLFTDKVDEEFKRIRALLKENRRNREKYCKADISKQASDVYEMRFTNNGRNDRIYCREFHPSGTRIIVMIELYVGKKQQKIPNKIKQKLKIISSYGYQY